MAQTPGAGRPGAERTSTQSDFRLAVADSSVVMLGIAVLGLGLGIILNAHGLPIWTAPLLSALVLPVRWSSSWWAWSAAARP